MKKNRNAILRSHGLDLETVSFFRARLDCVQPFPSRIIANKLRRLHAYYEKVENAQRVCNDLAAELNFMGIPVPIWDGGLNGPDKWEDHSFLWNLETEEWGWSKPYQVFGKVREYTVRPENPVAARIWDQFAVAFEREPLRNAPFQRNVLRRFSGRSAKAASIQRGFHYAATTQARRAARA